MGMHARQRLFITIPSKSGPTPEPKRSKRSEGVAVCVGTKPQTLKGYTIMSVKVVISIIPAMSSGDTVDYVEPLPTLCECERR